MKKRWISAIALAVSYGLSAQMNDTLDLGEVLVRDNRYPVKFSETLRNITVLQAEELRNMPALSLQDVLSYVNSMDIRQRGVGGVQADMTMRGGNFDQCLVLIDGVKFSDPQTGHHMLNLPLNPGDIERIEVLRGSASRIFGQNGFAGAINIITRKDFRKGGSAALSYGQYGTGNLNLSLQGQTGKHLGQRISIGLATSDGYGANRDYRIGQFFYQGRYLLGNSAQLRLTGGMQAKNFGAQYFYTAPASGFSEYEETRMAFATLSGQFSGLSNLSFNLNWRGHADQFRLWREQHDRGVNQHYSNVYSADANLYHKSRFGVSSAGMEVRLETINSNSLGVHDRGIAGIFLEHRLPKMEHLSLVAGTNISYISGYGWVAYPGAEAGWNLGHGLRLNASLGRSFRVPTFTDLYYTDAGPSSLGNPNLEPESAWTYEGGLIWQKNRIIVQANYYYRSANTLIDWQKSSPTSATWMAVNVNGNVGQGLELQAEYRSKLPLIKQVRLGYTYGINGQLPGENISRYVYDYLRHQVVAALQLRYGKHFEQGIYYRYLERVSYPTAHVLDSRFSFVTKRLQVWVQYENITGTRYFLTRNVPMPEGWLRLGVNFRF